MYNKYNNLLRGEIMKKQLFILGLILGLIFVAGCAKQQIIGGDKDEHGCLIAAGYSWNATIGACVREWELNEGQRQAAKIVVAPLSYPVTVVEVEVLRCPGCFIVHLQRNDNQEQSEIKLINWTISKEPVACTEEAKICPDGVTAVGRNSENNCEFDPCPSETGGVGIANPASVYCEEQGGTSKIITEQDGSQSGVCVLKDGTECDEWAYYRGECPAAKKTYCTPAQRGAEVCTMEYRPVCGWFNESIQCIRYPCAATYSNPCMACADDKVAYWTEGECPK